MNIKKPVDYSTMYRELTTIPAKNLPQMIEIHAIGKVISQRPEKGAAVAAAEFLQANFPDRTGFSPRNVRRMRDFYKVYENDQTLLRLAMKIGWTLNVVIMEAELTRDARKWYLEQAREQKWSKVVFLEKLGSAAHLEKSLDESKQGWYTKENDEFPERMQHEEDPVYLPRQHLPQSDGGVRDEELGEKSRAGITISYRVGGDQPGRNRKSGLSSGAAQAGGTWDQLQRSCSAAADEPRLRRIRSADWHGQFQPAGYAPHLRRRLCRQDVPPDGSYRPPRQCGRSLVHRRFRCDLAGRVGRVPGAAERIMTGTR